MGPDNIKLGAGTLYIETPDGLEPMGEISETVEIEFAEDTEPVVRISKGLEEVSLSLELVGEAAQEAAARLAELARSFCEHVGFACSNRRVTHLARYGSTWRIRKKNVRRMLKMAARRAKI